MNKNTRLIIVFVFLIAIIVGFVIIKKQQTTTNSNEPISLTSPTPTTGPSPSMTATPSPSPTTEKNSSPKLSYSQAVTKYGNYRIQFDATCQAHPNNLTFKKGTQLMLDNRSNSTKVINFNGTKHTIAAYDYTVINLVSANGYPATVLVDCGTAQNVAKVTIQE